MTSDVWLPIGTLILGYVGSLVTEWFRDKRLTARERAIRRDDFQRATLIELQQALQDLARAASALYIEDAQNYRKTGRWAETPTSPEWNEREREAKARAHMFKVRVPDEKLRQLVQAMTSAAAESSPDQSGEEEAGIKLHEMWDNLMEANERLGQLLRDL